MTDRKIITAFVHPPIPDRNSDWCAYYDGDEDGQRGWGLSEEAAVLDLKERERE